MATAPEPNSSRLTEYFLHWRCQWDPQQLFQPILKRLGVLSVTPGRRGP